MNITMNNIKFVENNYNYQENHLFQELFNRDNSITNLNSFLDGKTLPNSFKQGTDKCLLLKPDEDTIIVLLYIEERKAIDSYHYGIQLSKKTALLWKALNS